jgi:hypothetical protein
LHLVGYLYYWQMGFNSVFKGLNSALGVLGLVNATPRPLHSRERYPVSIMQEAGWASGSVWTGAENLAPTGIRSLDRPALNESLSLLRCPAPKVGVEQTFIAQGSFESLQTLRGPQIYVLKVLSKAKIVCILSYFKITFNLW